MNRRRFLRLAAGVAALVPLVASVAPGPIPPESAQIFGRSDFPLYRVEADHHQSLGTAVETPNGVGLVELDADPLVDEGEVKALEQWTRKIKSGEVTIRSNCRTTNADPEHSEVRLWVDQYICTPEGKALIASMANEFLETTA